MYAGFPIFRRPSGGRCRGGQDSFFEKNPGKKRPGPAGPGPKSGANGGARLKPARGDKSALSLPPRPLRPNMWSLPPVRGRGAPGLVIPGKAGAGTRAATRAAPTGRAGALAGRGRPAPHVFLGDGGCGVPRQFANWLSMPGGRVEMQGLVAACLHLVKRNYLQVLPGHMPRGDSRSCSSACPYELQRLSGFAIPQKPYRRPDASWGPGGGG